jgi:hypothetical protein
MTANQQSAAGIPNQSTRSERDRLDARDTKSQLFLTVEQAAQRLNVGRSTLYALRQSVSLRASLLADCVAFHSKQSSSLSNHYATGSEPCRWRLLPFAENWWRRQHCPGET